jgi:opacity protein-like surface antigen
MSNTSLNRLCCCAALTLLTLSTAPVAAQVPVSATPTTPAAAASKPAPTGKSGLSRKNNFLLGLGTNFSFTNSTNELVAPANGANEASNSTLFWVLNPEFGWFINDNFQLSINTGVILRLLQREDGNTNMERDWLANVGVKYHIGLNDQFSIIPGIGIGMYFGSSERQLVTTDSAGTARVFDEPTSTLGLDLWTQLMLGYLVGTNTELQAGFQFRMLYGTETIDSQNKDLSAFTINTGLALNLTYYL